MNLVSQKMGLHEWSYGNDYEAAARARMRHVELAERLRNLEVEVELGFDFGADAQRGGALPELRRADALHRALCIECDACMDVCPVNCLTITPNGEEEELRAAADRPRAEPRSSRSTSAAPLPQTARVMVKDEDICIHCGLCAERCPTAAWDMRRSDCWSPTPACRGSARTDAAAQSADPDERDDLPRPRRRPAPVPAGAA